MTSSDDIYYLFHKVANVHHIVVLGWSVNQLHRRWPCGFKRRGSWCSSRLWSDPWVIPKSTHWPSCASPHVTLLDFVIKTAATKLITCEALNPKFTFLNLGHRCMELSLATWEMWMKLSHLDIIQPISHLLCLV